MLKSKGGMPLGASGGSSTAGRRMGPAASCRVRDYLGLVVGNGVTGTGADGEPPEIGAGAGTSGLVVAGTLAGGGSRPALPASVFALASPSLAGVNADL